MKRVFISFRAEDKAKVNGLRLLAANPKFDLEFFDESVRVPYDSENASYIKQQIKAKIARTSITVCMLSAETYSSKWVCWELDESIDKGNSIILMGFKDGPESLRLPAPVSGQTWWFWSHEKLYELIEEAP